MKAAGKAVSGKAVRYGLPLVLAALICCAVRALPYMGAREAFQTDVFTVCPKPDGDPRTRFLSEPFFLKKGIYTIQYDGTVPVETEIVAGAADRLLTEDGADLSRGVQCIPLRVPGGSAHREWRILAERDLEAALLVREYYEGNGVPQAAMTVRVIYRPMLSAGCYIIDTLLAFGILAVFLLTLRPLVLLYRTRRPDARPAGADVPAESFTAWIPLLLFVAVVLVSLPLFRGFVTYGHDTVFHVRRIASLSEELFSGRIPVRLSQSWKNGYGYPVHIFYGDLFLLPAAVLFRFGVPLFRCYQLCAILMNALTVLLSYRCFLGICGKPRAALFLSVMYAGSVRYAANLYLRGAIGEDLGMAVLPLVVSGFYELMREGEPSRGERLPERSGGHLWGALRARGILYLVSGFTALIQAHILTTIQAVIFAFLFCLLNLRTILRGNRLPALFIAAGLTGLLNLWFLVPFTDYYGRHSFYAKLSTSVAETAVKPFRLLVPEESFQTIGAGTLLLLVVCTVLMVTGNRNRISRSVPVLAFLAVWMGTTLFPWAWMETHLPALYGLIGGRMQYVWRYFSVATLLVCVSAACLLRETAFDTKNKMRAGLIAAVLLASVSLGGSFRVQWESLHPVEEKPVLRAADVWSGDGGDALYMFDDLWWYETFPDTILAEEGISYTNVSREGTSFSLEVENRTEEEKRIALPVWNYYGYRALGSAEGIPDTDLAVTDGEAHRVRVTVPASFHGLVTVRFREPWYWRVSEAVSLLTLLGIVVICARFVRYDRM